MAKETMQAVSEAEKAAADRILHAKQEGEQLISGAQNQAQKLVEDARKEARKRVEVLLGVARADGEKRKARGLEETQRDQEKLRAAAQAAMPQAVQAIREIVLGRGKGGPG